MELSIFWAKLLGLYSLIIAAELLIRRHEIEKAVVDFASSKGLLMFSGSISLLLGLTIVISHPIYEASWYGLITFLGYVLILRGIWRIAFPSRLQKKMVTCFRQGHLGIFFVLLILGAYLTYVGFTSY